MLRQFLLTVVLFALACQCTAPSCLNGGEKKPDSESGNVVRDVLVRFDKNWKDYTNEPNYGDPRWKLKMETLVGLARAGAAAVPVLEAAAKENSRWAPHTRNLAAYALKIWHQDAAIRDAWANYDLSGMDVAKEGKHAPDFALADAAGQTYRLSDYRGKKTVVVTFILQDI
jgi:AhpC/TSA family